MRHLDETLTQRLEEVSKGQPEVISTTGTRAAIEALLIRTERLENVLADLAAAIGDPRTDDPVTSTDDVPRARD